MHLLPDDRSLTGDSPDLHATHLRLTNRLDALCAIHEGAAARLHQLPYPEFERACGAMRRFDHLRDLMRLRLFALRNCHPAAPSATKDRLLAEWGPLLRASRRLERLTGNSTQDPQP